MSISDTISDFWAIIVLVGLLIIVPAYRQYEMSDKLVYSQVQNVTSRFQYEACKSGYIDKKMYEELSTKLGATGRSYDVKFVHREAKYYPLSPGHPQYTKEKPFIQNFEEHHEKEILKKIYDRSSNNNNIYRMHVNDDFKVIVKERGPSQSSILKNMVSPSAHNSSYIFAEYGGGVQNEVK